MCCHFYILSMQEGFPCRWECPKCSEMMPPKKMFRSSVRSHISKCVDDMVITKTKSFPNQKDWMSREVRGLQRANKASWQEAYNTTRANWKLASKRQSGDVRRDWRQTSTRTAKKCGRRFEISQATEARATHHAWGHITRWEHILWSLWSPQQKVSCKIYSTCRRPVTVSIHSWCEKYPVESQ